MARHVRGSYIEVRKTPSSPLLTLGCVYAMAFPDLMRGTADVTCMNSTAFYREFIKGFKDSGEVTFKLRFDDAAYALLKTIFEDDTCNTMPEWLFNFGNCPGESLFFFGFNGILTKLGIPEKSIDGENIWEVDASVKISGRTTFYKNVNTVVA